MPYSVKGFFEINEDMVQILLMLEVLFTQNSKVEDLFCGASSGSEPSLFFSNYFFSLGFQPIQDDFPWTQNPPKVILDLHKNKKSEVDSQIFKTEFLEIKSAYKHYISIYTDGSKQDEKVACAVISPNFTDSIRLPDRSSIFTAVAKAIDIALYHIRDQPEKQFIIYSHSLSV